MQFQNLALIMGMLSTMVLGAPVSEANVSPASPLLARGGNHRALIYTDANCAGVSLVNSYNFGCGGTCYTFQEGRSILMTQDNTGGSKPTASLYASTNCAGTHQSAGIAELQYSGCTSASSTLPVWHSAYLYFNC